MQAGHAAAVARATNQPLEWEVDHVPLVPEFKNRRDAVLIALPRRARH